MDFFGFALSVWAAVGFGVFFLVLIAACTADRHNNAAPKWLVLAAGLIALAVWQKDQLSWSLLTNGAVWSNVGIYLGIGLAYAMVEFFFTVRREARQWSERWARYKNSVSCGVSKADLVDGFCRQNRGGDGIVSVQNINDDVVPTVDRGKLSAFVGAWTVFWPGYFVSWAIGDLLAEVFGKISSVIAALSSRFVRNTFADVFKA